MAKIVDKNELLEKINDRKWYLNHQLDLYYHFDRTIDRKLLSDREVAFALINVSDILFRELPKNLRDDEELAGVDELCGAGVDELTGADFSLD